ncbi:MAG: hypothetical protein KDN22_03635 [Verrucomicrobiae bacterium]|nr:hypothetical protein [Verrucomicrobiae bacterium]
MNYPCPQCSTGIAVVEETAGKSVPCPKCTHSVKLPRLATAKLTLRDDGNVSGSDQSAESLTETVAKSVESSGSVKVTATVEVNIPVSGAGIKTVETDEDIPVAAVLTGSAESPGENEPLIAELGAPDDGVSIASADDDDDIPVAVIEDLGEVEVSRPPVARAKAKSARRDPLAKIVKEKRKDVIIPKAVDTLIPEPRLKPGEAGSPGNFTLKEPTHKIAKEVKVRPVLMRAAQADAAREFRGFKGKIDDGPVERISPDEAAPVQVRPRSKIGQLFGRARDFILADPKLRKGPAPDDARDHELKEKYRLQEPTERQAPSVDVRPIAKRGNDEVSGFHDVMDRFVPLHEFEEMEGFGEMSKEEQEAILQAQAEVEQIRVSTTNKRMFFSALVFAAPAVVAVSILAWHAMKAGDPEAVPVPVEPESMTSRLLQVYSIEDASSLAMKVDSASTVEELAELTRDPEASLPRMREYYERVAFRPNQLRYVQNGAGGDIDLPGEGFLWVMATTRDYSDRMLAFEKTSSGLRFDWESYVNYSEVPWTDFVDQQHARKSEFRVTLSKDDYYNNGFSEEEYLCYRLTDPDNQRTCYGYALRASQTAGILEGKLGLLRAQAEEDSGAILGAGVSGEDLQMPRTQSEDDGIPIDRAEVKVIVRLRFPSQSDGAGQAIISKVVCSGWVKP